MQEFLTPNEEDIKLNYWEHYYIMRHPHTHTHFELYFCPGDLQQHAVINGMEYHFHYPCVIFSTPYTVHAMSSLDDPEKGYRRYVFDFSSQVVNQFDKVLLPEDLFCRNVGFMFRLSKEDAAYLVGLIEILHAETKTELMILLAAFLNQLIKCSPLEKALKVGESNFYIREVMQFIAENYMSDLDSDEIAHRFSVSRSKLYRDFKQFTGITVHAFSDECRLNQAKLLLERAASLSIHAIAERCGFSGENYFFPFFKKYTGLTPIEYRNQILGQL